MKYLSFLALFTTLSWANFAIEPFVVVLRGNSGQLTGWVNLKTNQNVRPVPVELTIHQRNMNLDGQENMDSPESDLLVVYPSEIVLFPGEETKVQISWAKKQRPDRDMAFTLVASEVPLNLAEKNPESQNKPVAAISTLVRYRAVVAIETGNKGRLVVNAARMDSTGRQVEIHVENKGLGRVPTDGMHLIIRGVKYSHFIGANSNSIMPGEKRRFLLEIPFIPKPSEIKFGY